jgi:transketolase
MLTSAIDAAEMLESKSGISLKVVNMPWLNKIDLSWLKKTIVDAKKIITLDNQYIIGGLGDLIAGSVAEIGANIKVEKIGITKTPPSGTIEEVLLATGLDPAGIFRRITQSWS